MRRQKYVEDSRTENTYLIMPKHINGYGRLFGGVLMQWIDEVAGTVARRHAGSIVTTACVDNLNFKAGAYLGNTIVLIGKMTYVGKTSMEVRVDTMWKTWTEPGRSSTEPMRCWWPLIRITTSWRFLGWPWRQSRKRPNGSAVKNVMHCGSRDAEKDTDREAPGGASIRIIRKTFDLFQDK